MNEITNFAKSLKEAFSAHGVILPESKIEKMNEDLLMEADEFLLLQKYGRPAVRVASQQINSIEEMIEFGKLSNSLVVDTVHNFPVFFSPAMGEEEELVIYWDGEDQIIPGGYGLYPFFKEKGFEVIEKAHPSYLIKAMGQLTEEKLAKIGIPRGVNIILPTREDYLYLGGIDNPCFLEVNRRNGNRSLDLITACGRMSNFNKGYAFLVRKIKVN